MALNFSHRPIFPAHRAEDNLVSSMRIANGCLVEGISERNRDGFAKQWQSGRGEVHQDRFDYENDSMDWDSVLPADSFGMDISSTVSAITGLIEYLEADYGSCSMGEAGVGRGDYSVFAGLNFFFNKAMDFHPFQGNTKVDDRMFVDDGFERCLHEEDWGYHSPDGDIFACCTDSLRCDVPNISGIDLNVNHEEVTGINADPDDGDPHPAMSFALAYLGVRDLLSVERVCKSLRFTVQNDPLLWKSIQIDSCQNEQINDDIIVQITNRAQGHLQCLSVIDCLRFTDDGLKRFLERNPRLSKLCVPGCSKLSIDGLMSCLRDFKTRAITGIKHLRIATLYGWSDKQFEELMSLLRVDHHVREKRHNPRIYGRDQYCLSSDDDRPVDIEKCPRCQSFRLVFDCPSEHCQTTEAAASSCRACKLCVPRCAECGVCFIQGDYVETFCLELVCQRCCLSRPHLMQEIQHCPLEHAVPEELSSSLDG